MIRTATGLLVVALTLTLATVSSAVSLRSPQVAVQGGTLQAYLDGIGESIDVLNAQADAQVWTSTVSGNSTFTLMIELSGNASGNAIGLYNASDPSPTPTQFEVFPGAATAGWFAIASFRPGGALIVNLFDDTSTLQGTTTYSGVDRTNFSFYLAGGAGTYYAQDARNANEAHALFYAGTGANSGSWWQCWEDGGGAGGGQRVADLGDSDYDDAVLFLESVNPTPTETGSWGSLKRRYR